MTMDADSGTQLGARPAIPELFGPRGRHRQHGLAGNRLQALEVSQSVHGSRETAMRARGYPKGSAAQIRHAQLAIYTRETRIAFERSLE